MCIGYEPNWMTLIILYLQEGVLLQYLKAARMLLGKAAHYTLVDQVLYRRSFISPLLKCLERSEADYSMLEIHEGICGSHSARTILAHKTLRHRYYWPTLRHDCLDYVKRRVKCQLFVTVPRVPSVYPTSILSPIPFDMWGLDIMRIFPPGRGNLKFLLVAVDYMTK